VHQAPHPRARPAAGFNREHPPAQARVPADARDLVALHRQYFAETRPHCSIRVRATAPRERRRARAKVTNDFRNDVLFSTSRRRGPWSSWATAVAHRGGRVPVSEPESPPRTGSSQAELPVPDVMRMRRALGSFRRPDEIVGCSSPACLVVSHGSCSSPPRVRTVSARCESHVRHWLGRRRYCWATTRPVSSAPGMGYPTRAPRPYGHLTFASLSAGDGFTCGVPLRRRLLLGRNPYGQLGSRTPQPE